MSARRWGVAGTAVVAAALAVLVLGHDPLEAGATMAALGDGESTLLPEFGERGSLILRYEHGAHGGYAFTLRNRGPLPVTVTSVAPSAREEHPLLEAVEVRLGPAGHRTIPGDDAAGIPFAPFRLDPGEQRLVALGGRFASCAYYTERAMEVREGHVVRYRLLGVSRAQEVTYPHRVIVRSPTISNCPDRVMDRAARRRTDP